MSRLRSTEMSLRLMLLLGAMALCPAAGALAATTGVLVVDWDANEVDVDLNGYRVYMSTDPSVFDLSPSQARSRATTRALPPGVLESTFSSLETAGTYFIAVTAFDSSGNESPFSPVVAAKPCDASTSGSLSVTWDAASSSSATGYRVYVAEDAEVFDMSPSEAQAQSRTRSVASGGTDALFTGLDTGRTYYVGVTSYDATGTESAFSEVLAVTPSLMPTLCSVQPWSAPQGTVSTDVTLYGANLLAGATADFGPDIIVRSIDSSGAPSRLVARVDIGPFAQADSRDVVVTNPDGGVSIIPAAFDVKINLDRADINGSSRIDGGDMVQIAAAFSSRQGDSRYSLSFDLNVDGVVDGMDLSLLIIHFGMIGPF